MSTIAQITANRANAQHSTGPKTPAGSDASKLNAIRHGLTSKHVVIKGEDPAAYDALRAELIAEYDPQSESEAMLVEHFVQNWWRLNRARRIEAKMLEDFGEIEAYSNKAFINLQRQMQVAERAWGKTYRELEMIKKARLERAAMFSYVQQRRAAAGLSSPAPEERPTAQLGSFLQPRDEAVPADVSSGVRPIR
jgi:hypothetical protein